MRGGLQVPRTDRAQPYHPDRIGLAHRLWTEAFADPDAGEVATKMRAVHITLKDPVVDYQSGFL